MVFVHNRWYGDDAEKLLKDRKEDVRSLELNGKAEIPQIAEKIKSILGIN